MKRNLFQPFKVPTKKVIIEKELQDIPQMQKNNKNSTLHFCEKQSYLTAPPPLPVPTTPPSSL